MKAFAFLLCLVLLTFCTEPPGSRDGSRGAPRGLDRMNEHFVFGENANPLVKESFAKQLLRSKRQKPGYPDEPMREHMLHMQQLELRARETNIENLFNPHCAPRCDRNYGYPV